MANNKRVQSPIKVLIVDDEQLVRKGLRMTIDWEKHQMIVIDDASNGSLGWQQFLQHRPDLVITDIVMPEMDGIELAQKIKQKAPETKIMFLSCHRDFVYAKQGIQIGVQDYIVKTDMDDELIDKSLHRVSLEIQEMKKKYQTPITLVKNHQEQNLETLGTWLNNHSYSAQNHLVQQLHTEWKWMLPDAYLFHLYNAPADGGDISSSLHKWKDLSVAYKDQLKLLEIDHNSALLICNRGLLDICHTELVELKLKNNSIEWRQAGPIVSVEGWLAAVSKLYRLWKVESNTRLLSVTHKEDIIEAIDFIDQHLDTDLRAADVATKIGVSRSYFSTIFKEATGCSIISFISERKMKRAKELLSATTIRTEEVAEKVGIPDVKYFSKWFKKRAELTPGQYRTRTK